jgi:flagellar protein FliS
MLFDGALAALSKAANDMKAGNIAAKGKSISHAISIIDNGLRASLDKKAGGSIAEQLDSLYEYMSGRLLAANLNNQPELLEEVRRMLLELKGAWEQIAPQAAGERAAEQAVKA